MPCTPGMQEVPQGSLYIAPHRDQAFRKKDQGNSQQCDLRPQTKRGKQVLLMTCREKITGPDGSVTHARVFLDPGASCSFVTERLAQQLKLPRRRDNSVIAGIAGVNATRARGAMSFTLSHVSGKGGRVNVHVENASVLSEYAWTCHSVRWIPSANGN